MCSIWLINQEFAFLFSRDFDWLWHFFAKFKQKQFKTVTKTMQFSEILDKTII